jgi:hypothetical protein
LSKLGAKCTEFGKIIAEVGFRNPLLRLDSAWKHHAG